MGFGVGLCGFCSLLDLLVGVLMEKYEIGLPDAEGAKVTQKTQMNTEMDANLIYFRSYFDSTL